MNLALIALLALVGCALALPAQIEQHPTFTRSSSSDNSGQFNTHTRTSDGVVQHSVGELAVARDGTIYLRQIGSVTYTSPEGRTVILNYRGDDDGYRASGTDIHGASQL